MNKLALALCATTALALAQETPKQETKLRPMALMIMLDGWRADSLENTQMVNIRRLAQGQWQKGYNGAYTMDAHTIPDAPASSAANHTAIATGVTANKNGIRYNSNFKRKDLDWSKWPSWLVRLTKAQPEKKALFIYSWKPDTALSPDPAVEFIHGSDDANAKTLPERLAAQNAPDATLYFIDLCDHAGHKYGFYPYTQQYIDTAAKADEIVGRSLAAIASRPTFDKEDWLITLTADHGGYAKTHGLFGGHATTIPLVLAGRHITNGRIRGFHHNYDLAPTTLKHFGVDTSAMNLDGKAIEGGTPEPAPRKLSDGLVAYLPFDDSKAKNEAKNGLATEVREGTTSGAEGGIVGGCLDVAKGGGVLLKGSERLAYENGGDFAIVLWSKTPAAQEGDPVLLSNKDWRNGRNPGIAIVASKCTQSVKVPGVCFNAGLENKGRIDMGTYDHDYGKWTFYALVRSEDGMIRFYQGSPDGTLYWIADDVSKMVLESGLPFYIGQDGTGKYVRGLNGEIDEFAFWTRSLSLKEVQEIYAAGRKSEALGKLLATPAR